MMDVSFADLCDSNQILVIKSVRDENFIHFMELLLAERSSSNCIFLCEETDIPFFKKFGISENNLVFHTGRLCSADVKKIPKSILTETEKICFCNYSDFRPTYANVEEFCLEFMRRNDKLSMYSFNVSKQTLNKYISAWRHYEGTRLLDSIFKWESLEKGTEEA